MRPSLVAKHSPVCPACLTWLLLALGAGCMLLPDAIARLGTRRDAQPSLLAGERQTKKLEHGGRSYAYDISPWAHIFLFPLTYRIRMGLCPSINKRIMGFLLGGWTYQIFYFFLPSPTCRYFPLSLLLRGWDR